MSYFFQFFQAPSGSDLPPAPSDWVGRWLFENNANDEGGNYNFTEEGTIGYTATAHTGSYALNLPGSGTSQLNCDAHRSIFAAGSGEDWAMSLWMRFLDTARRQVFSTDSNDENALERYSDGRLLWHLETTASSAGYNLWSVGTLTGDGNYHHIVIQRNGSVMEVWIDGSLDNSNDTSDTTAFRTDSANLSIGYGGSGAGYYYIDDMIIYDRSLSSGEIGTIYAG